VAFTNIASKVQIADAGKPSSVDISMNVDDQSTLTAKGTATPAKKGWMLEDGDFNVQISKLQLASLKPLFALAGRPMDMAGELNADATIQISQNRVRQLQAEAVISDFAQGTGEQRIVFEKPITLSAQAGQQGETVQIDKFKVDSEFCNVTCAGTLEAMDYTIDADLAQTQRLIGQFTDMGGLSMQGNLTAGGTVSMTDQAVKAAGKGSIEKLVVKKGDVSTPATDAQMDFDCTVDQEKNQLRLASANLSATPGSVKIANLVLPMGDQADKTVSLDAQAKLDLAKTWTYAQVFSEPLKDKNVSGQLDAALAISTTGNQIRLLTKNATCDNLKIEVPNTEPFVQEQVRLNGDILLDTEQKTIDIQDFDLQGKQGQTLIKITKGAVEKKVSSDTTQINGDFEAQYDWQTLSTFASVYLPTGLSVQGTRNDSFHFASKYPTDQPEQMKANLNAAGMIGFDKASYFGLNFGKTDISLNIKKGVAFLNIPETIVNEGKFQFAGQVDLNQEPMMLRLQKPTQVIDNVHINDEMTHKLLKYLSPVFANQSRVSGVASLRCDRLEIPFSAEDKKKMTIDATVAMDNVQLKSIGLIGAILKLTDNRSEFTAKLLPTQFQLANNVLQYDSMEFQIEEYPLGFSGQVHLGDTGKKVEYELNIALPYQVGRDGFRTIKVGEDLSERLVAKYEEPFRVEKLLGPSVEQILQKEIQRGLEKIFN
jgi:hypothetical protein